MITSTCVRPVAMGLAAVALTSIGCASHTNSSADAPILAEQARDTCVALIVRTLRELPSETYATKREVLLLPTEDTPLTATYYMNYQLHATSGDNIATVNAVIGAFTAAGWSVTPGHIRASATTPDGYSLVTRGGPGFAPEIDCTSPKFPYLMHDKNAVGDPADTLSQ